MDTQDSLSDQQPVALELGTRRPSLNRGAEQVIQLRVSRAQAHELQEMLEAEGVYDTRMHYAGNVPPLVEIFASIAGSLGALAAVLSAFFRRHQDRAVLIERDGTRYELKGMGVAEMTERIERILRETTQEELDSDDPDGARPGEEDDESK